MCCCAECVPASLRLPLRAENSRFRMNKTVPFRLVNAKYHFACLVDIGSDRKKDNDKRDGDIELFYAESRATMFSSCLVDRKFRATDDHFNFLRWNTDRLTSSCWMLKTCGFISMILVTILVVQVVSFVRVYLYRHAKE